MVRELVHDPLFLARKAEQAERSDIMIIMDLLDTLNAHKRDCAGMAANMIGFNKNIIAVNVGVAQMIMVNAKITKKSKPFEAEEGCLSLLGGPRKATRYENIEVEFLDMNFKPKKESFSGWVAQVIQHELDHVAGVLI